MPYYKFQTTDERYPVGVDAINYTIAWNRFCANVTESVIKKHKTMSAYLRVKPKSKSRSNIMLNFKLDKL